MLARVLPLMAIAPQCKIESVWVIVQGKLGTYRILRPWGTVSRMTDHAALPITIPQELLEAAPIDFSALPIDIDYRTEMILRKAHVLANDWNIQSPDLIQQLM
jgi:hypothetical protein